STGANSRSAGGSSSGALPAPPAGAVGAGVAPDASDASDAAPIIGTQASTVTTSSPASDRNRPDGGSGSPPTISTVPNLQRRKTKSHGMVRTEGELYVVWITLTGKVTY